VFNFLCFNGAAVQADQQTGVKPTLVNGFDWSLPPNTQREPYSGLIGEGDQILDSVQNSFVIVRWDKANPQPGVYQFEQFEKDLARVAPRNVLVRLEVNSACETPPWALEQLRSTKDKSLVFWDKNYLKVLRPFIHEFAQRYAANPQIIGVQLGIADGEYAGSCDDFDNKDGWGEFWMSPEVIAEAEQNFGFNPPIFEQRSKAIIDLYATAFGPYKYKLAYTNFGPFSWNDIAIPYNQRMLKLAHYAQNLGLGNRDGGTEQWLDLVGNIYGNTVISHVDGTCSLGFDERFAQKIQGRYWGTENEFYGKYDYVINKHGPYQNQPYRFLISSLRALQMRRNFVSISESSMAEMDHPIYHTQTFLDYLNKVLGKGMEASPDAFILLGERYMQGSQMADYSQEKCVRNDQDRIAIRAFGRWITDQSQSQPALKISMPASEHYWAQDFYLPDGIDYEYSARQAKQFRFDLNDELAQKRCHNGCNVALKVTFKDNLRTALQIQTAEGKSALLKTSADQQIKTATFRMNSKFQNKLNGSDLIISSNKGEIPLILLRINFLD